MEIEWCPAKPPKVGRGSLPVIDRAMRRARRMNGRYPRVLRLTVDERGRVAAAEVVK